MTTWHEQPLFDADWNPEDGEQLDMFGPATTAGPPKLWPDQTTTTKERDTQ